MKAFVVLLCAALALVSAHLKPTSDLPGGFLPWRLDLGAEGVYGNTNGYISGNTLKTDVSKSYNNLYKSGIGGSNYASSYGYGKGSLNTAYLYRAPLTSYGYAPPSHEYSPSAPSYSVPAYRYIYTVPQYKYSSVPAFRFSYPVPSAEYTYAVPSYDYSDTYSVPTDTYALQTLDSFPSISLVRSLPYSLPPTSYVEKPVNKVVNVKKVVNVQREVVVPQVVQVKKIITEPKVVTVHQVVPAGTQYYSGISNGVSNTFTSTSSGNSETVSPSSSYNNADSSAIQSSAVPSTGVSGNFAVASSSTSTNSASAASGTNV